MKCICFFQMATGNSLCSYAPLERNQCISIAVSLGGAMMPQPESPCQCAFKGQGRVEGSLGIYCYNLLTNTGLNKMQGALGNPLQGSPNMVVKKKGDRNPLPLLNDKHTAVQVRRCDSAFHPPLHTLTVVQPLPESLKATGIPLSKTSDSENLLFHPETWDQPDLTGQPHSVRQISASFLHKREARG